MSIFSYISLLSLYVFTYIAMYPESSHDAFLHYVGYSCLSSPPDTTAQVVVALIITLIKSPELIFLIWISPRLAGATSSELIVKLA